MSSFHNVYLPHFLAVHAKGGPSFSTSHVITASGREVRNSDRYNAIQEYVIDGCRLGKEQFVEFNSFFRARMGKRFSFRLRDYADCLLKDQVIGVGDGQIIKFQIYKTYHSDINAYRRRITKIDSNHLDITLDDIRIDPVVDYNSGIITLSRPLIHSKELILRNGVFDVEVRFVSDEFKYHIHQDGSVMIDNLGLIEVV